MSIDARKRNPESWLAAGWSLVLRILVVAVVGYVLYRVREIIVIVLVAVMLTFTVAPLVDWLQRTSWFRAIPRHARRSVATILVFCLLLLGLVELLVVVVKPLVQEVSHLSQVWHLQGMQAPMQWKDRIQWLQARYNDLPEWTRDWLESQDLKDVGSRVAEQVQHVLQHTAVSVMFLVELILIPVLAYSFSTESRPIKHEFALFIPPARLRDWLYMLRQTGLILQSYAVGQMILALIAGVTIWLLTTALGLHYTLAMACIAAITRVIPVVGPLIGGVPILLLTLVEGGWEKAVAVLVALTVMHLIETKFIMPRIIGDRINLHPALVIIALLIGAEFFGMWGMFLAAPAAAIAKMILHHLYVRPELRRPGSKPRPPSPLPRKEPEVERSPIAGVRHHSSAH